MKPFQPDFFEKRLPSETAEEVIQQGEHAIEEEAEKEQERVSLEDLRAAGFLSAEERKKEKDEAPGRKAAREYAKKLNKEILF